MSTRIIFLIHANTFDGRNLIVRASSRLSTVATINGALHRMPIARRYVREICRPVQKRTPFQRKPSPLKYEHDDDNDDFECLALPRVTSETILNELLDEFYTPEPQPGHVDNEQCVEDFDAFPLV